MNTTEEKIQSELFQDAQTLILTELPLADAYLMLYHFNYLVMAMANSEFERSNRIYQVWKTVAETEPRDYHESFRYGWLKSFIARATEIDITN